MSLGAEVLRTDRLVLREVTEADAPFLLHLLNDPGFLRYIGDRGVRTLDDARAYAETGPRASYQTFGFGLWRVERRPDGVPVGMCGLLQREFLDAPDLGYAFLAAHTGRGYAREAARAALRHAREAFGLGTVYAYVDPDNARSARLLTDLGFRFERTFSLPETGAEADLYRAG